MTIQAPHTLDFHTTTNWTLVIAFHTLSVPGGVSDYTRRGDKSADSPATAALIVVATPVGLKAPKRGESVSSNLGVTIRGHSVYCPDCCSSRGIVSYNGCPKP